MLAKKMRNKAEVKSDELSYSSMAESIKEERLHETPKNVISLRDIPLEARKKEARKPIYLIRYE